MLTRAPRGADAGTLSAPVRQLRLLTLGARAVLGQGPQGRRPDDQRPGRDAARQAGLRAGRPRPALPGAGRRLVRVAGLPDGDRRQGQAAQAAVLHPPRRRRPARRSPACTSSGATASVRRRRPGRVADHLHHRHDRGRARSRPASTTASRWCSSRDRLGRGGSTPATTDAGPSRARALEPPCAGPVRGLPGQPRRRRRAQQRRRSCSSRCRAELAASSTPMTGEVARRATGRLRSRGRSSATAAAPARAHVRRPAGAGGTVVLGHGAGGGLAALDLDLRAGEAPRRRLGGRPRRAAVAGGRSAGRRTAARARRRLAALVRGAARAGGRACRGPLVFGGRSAGARVACRPPPRSGPTASLCSRLPAAPARSPDRLREPRARPGRRRRWCRPGPERDPFGSAGGGAARSAARAPRSRQVPGCATRLHRAGPREALAAVRADVMGIAAGRRCCPAWSPAPPTEPPSGRRASWLRRPATPQRSSAGTR